MRDQCAAIFRQARKELEAAGLLNENKEGGQSSSNEETLAADIDKELENLKVRMYSFHFIFQGFLSEFNFSWY